MTDLKLGRLPDRTPVRITITVSPELNRALRQYAGLYRATYGQAEPVADLIPFMLGAFLDSDKGFARARKDEPADALPEPESPRRGRRPASPSTDNTEA